LLTDVTTESFTRNELLINR